MCLISTCVFQGNSNAWKFMNAGYEINEFLNFGIRNNKINTFCTNDLQVFEFKNAMPLLYSLTSGALLTLINKT